LTVVAIFMLFLFLPAGIYAQTHVSGNIKQNTTWTVAGSPYIVTGDVTVRHSQFGASNIATLTIDPGVEVRFEPGTGLYVGYKGGRPYYHSYYGALTAQGTASAPIIFTSDAAGPAPGDWKGIYFATKPSMD
jgi:hypothetical protein